MNLKPSWKSRAVAVLILIALLVGLTFLSVAPLRGAAELRQRIEARGLLLAGLARKADRIQSALGKGDDAASATRANTALLKAATTGLAGAHLQKILIAIAQRTGGRPSSVQVLGARPDGELLRIPVNLTISTGTKGLRDFLYELETHMPLLFVDEMTLRRMGSPTAAPGGAGRRNLQVTLKISGFMPKGSGS